MAVGFGEEANAHKNTDVWGVEFLKDVNNVTSYNLYDMYSNSFVYPFMDTDIGGTYDFTNITFGTEANVTTVLSFVRNLNTTDPNDFIFEVVKYTF